MSKKLGIVTKNTIRFFNIKKTTKPIAEINDRIYRIDDTLFISQSDAANSILLYQMDAAQPMGHGEFLDPDLTKAYIDSMKRGKKKPSKMSDFSLQKFIPIIIIVAVIMSFVYVLNR